MEKNKKFFLYVCVICLLLLFFTIYRAITTNITYDEAYTYFNYVYYNPFKVFTHIFKNGTLANNHLLNSFFISFFKTSINANYSEFLVRLPNIFFYIIYLIFSYLISRDSKYKYALFTMLALNYGANEFFGLARGYGIASSLVLVGLYMFKKYINNPKNFKYLTLTYLFFLISCYANTVSLIPFGAVILSSCIILIKNKEIVSYIKKQLVPIILIVLAALLIIKYHFMISSDGLPLYGGKTSFYNDVIVSYFIEYGFNFKYLHYFINILCITFYTIIVINYKKLKQNYMFIAGIIYFALLISMTIITGNMWTTGRCLLPSMPLIIVMIYEILETLTFNSKVINIVIIVPLLIVFITNINLNKTREWNYSLRKICYEAYEKKDNSIIEPIKNDYAINFYHKKILKEKNYDIYK